MADSSSDAGTRASLADGALALAGRWAIETAAADPDPAAERLSAVLQDPAAQDFMLGLVDRVLRTESLPAAASVLHHRAAEVPAALPRALRTLVRVGGEVAPVLPTPTVPIIRRALRDALGSLLIDGRPGRLSAAIDRLRPAEGEKVPASADVRLELELIGEPVLGDAAAQRRLDGIRDLIGRRGADAVLLAVGDILGRVSLWAFDELVDLAVERLAPLGLDALDARTRIMLDVARHRDLDLTIAVFTRLLEDPRLMRLDAGIVLPAGLPDALPALQELTVWAQDRVAHGGAPITVRVAAGADAAGERTEARLHGWTTAASDTALDADANYLRLLDWAVEAERLAAVRIVASGDNLFAAAYARTLTAERGIDDGVEIAMMLGASQARLRAVARECGPVRLLVPVAAPEAFDLALDRALRRAAERSVVDSFLSATIGRPDEEDPFARAQDLLVAAQARAADASLRAGPRRRQDRSKPVHESVRPAPAAPAPETDLTRAVLGIERGSEGAGDAFFETAVFSSRELANDTGGAPGFANAPDTDPSLSANREWASGIRSRVRDAEAVVVAVDARIDSTAAIEHLVARVRGAAQSWGGRPAAERAEALQRAAVALDARRATVIQIAATSGMTLPEADAEVTAAVDLARYYAATARELDAISGAAFEPPALTVAIAPRVPSILGAVSDALAALAAGSGVIIVPEPIPDDDLALDPLSATVVEALWQSGIPRDALALAEPADLDLARDLVVHEAVDRVLLTGSVRTAERLRSWRPDLRLQADTGGRGTVVVTPSADLDLAVRDIVTGAFPHAGQARSAAGLVIVVGAVGRSARFARQLADAVRSLRVGQPADPRGEVGPLAALPSGALARALTVLDADERWLVEPRPVAGDESGLLWHPGVRVGVHPGSAFHLDDIHGPVIGVIHVPTLTRAVEVQNALATGAAAALHTQSADDLGYWLDAVEAGDLFVNRAVGAGLAQRRPGGGWKRSTVGPGAKTGGPHRLVALGSWRSVPGSPASSTLHLRGLDSRITDLIEAAQPSLDYEAFEWLRRSALSDALAWDREFSQVRDVSRLQVERNLLRYRRVPVEIRATGDAQWQELLRVVVAAVRAGSRFVLSTPVGLPAEVRRALGDAGVMVFMESDAEWLDRIRRHEVAEGEGDPAPRPDRVRLVGSRASVETLRLALADAVDGDIDLTVFDGEVTSAGRIELLPFLREQAITITAHRSGRPDDWSAAVI